MDNFEKPVSNPDLNALEQGRIKTRRDTDRSIVEHYVSAHRCSWGDALSSLGMCDPDDDANYVFNPSQIKKTIETDSEQKMTGPLDRITESQSKEIEDVANAMGCSYLEAVYDHFHLITLDEYRRLLYGEKEEEPTVLSSQDEPMDPEVEQKLKEIYEIIDDAIKYQKGNE